MPRRHFPSPVTDCSWANLPIAYQWIRHIEYQGSSNTEINLSNSANGAALLIELVEGVELPEKNRERKKMTDKRACDLE